MLFVFCFSLSYTVTVIVSQIEFMKCDFSIFTDKILDEKQKTFVKNDLVRELRGFLEMRIGF